MELVITLPFCVFFVITCAGGDEVRDRPVTEEDVLDLTMRHFTSKLAMK